MHVNIIPNILDNLILRILLFEDKSSMIHTTLLQRQCAESWHYALGNLIPSREFHTNNLMPMLNICRRTHLAHFTVRFRWAGFTRTVFFTKLAEL